jgi:uncharacterized protein DUF4232
MADVIALHRARRDTRAITALCLFVSLVAVTFSATSSPASANVDVHVCSSAQLAVAVPSSSGGYAAAGNEGIPFLIVNIGKRECMLEGYPKLKAYPASYKRQKVRFTDGGAMIFVAVKPRAVLIAPGSTASFGVDYGDAYDQGDPNAGPCLLKQMTVSLPVQPHPYSVPFSSNVDVNFCYAGFHFEVTAIQSGPIAKQG